LHERCTVAAPLYDAVTVNGYANRIEPLAASPTRSTSNVVVVTAVVLTVNENVVADGATVTTSGTAAEGSLLASESRHPSGGAGVARVPTHCAVVPPTTDVGEQVTLAIAGSATTTNDADCI
jgi:hypothetical protein